MPPRLVLLDSPAAYLDGGHVDLPVHKPAMLLVVLACAGNWVGRDQLISLFWPDAQEAEGRHRLRTSLMRARRQPWADGLEVQASRLRWLVDSDVRAYRDALARADWAAATDLHRRPLLEGLSLPSAPGLDAWLSAERESLLTSWRQAGLLRSTELKQQGRPAQATALLLRVLQSDALAEDALASYLEVAYLAGQRDEALAQYQRFRDELRRELGLEPLARTSALAALIREGAPLSADPVTEAARPLPLALERPPRLVGRDHERAAMQQATAAIVLVAGEPGAGKTRLLQEAFPTARWLHAREGLAAVPFHPLLELIRDQAKVGADLGPYRDELARLVPELLPTAAPDLSEPQAARTRLLGALAAWLESSATPLVLDDLQWADTGTTEVLTLLAARGHLRCYASYRVGEAGAALREVIDGWRTQRLLQELRLRPLAADDLGDLVVGVGGLVDNAGLINNQAAAAAAAPPGLGRWMFERSAGNPFFAIETLKELFGSGLLAAGEGSWGSQLAALADAPPDVAVPATVGQVIDRRLARLSEHTRRVLQVGSVLGDGLAARPLAALAGLSAWATLAAMDEAEAQGFMQGPGFSHDLLRQSVYQGLSEARRRHLHALVAERLHGSADPLLVAEHWSKSGDLNRALACHGEGVEDLLRRGLPSEALAVVQAALAQAEASVPAADGARLSTLRRLALSAHRQLGQHHAVLELAEGLSGPEHDPDTRMTAWTEAFNVRMQLGHHRQAAACLAAAEALMAQETVTPANRRAVGFMRAVMAFHDGRYLDAIATCEAMREEIRQGTMQERFDLAAHQASSWTMLGEYGRALAGADEALAMAKAMGAKPMIVNAAAQRLEILVRDQRPADGLAEGEAALALGEYLFSAELRNNLTMAYYRAGRLEEATLHAEAMVTQLSSPLWVACGWNHLITFHAEAGRPEKVVEALDRGLAMVAGVDVPLVHGRMLLGTLLHGSPAQRELALAKLLPLDWGRVPDELALRLRAQLPEGATARV